MKLGEIQELKIVKLINRGAILVDTESIEDDFAFLSKSELTPGDKKGNNVQVFLYNGKTDEILATKKIPPVTVGNLGKLVVRDHTKIGNFLDWGLDKDLFLPYGEQTFRPEKGKSYLFGLFIDKTGRLCATMKIRNMLRTDSKYALNDWVKGTVYSIHPEHGAFIAVDDKYDSIIPKKDLLGIVEEGEEINARVSAVSGDGRLVLSLRDRAHKAIDDDVEKIYNKLIKNCGYLKVTDNSSPEEIKRLFGFSKSAFKRAVGRLYKQKKIIIENDGIKLIKQK